MIWCDPTHIRDLKPTPQCLILADGKTRVECDGHGMIHTTSGTIKFPVLYVKSWPRNYVSVRILSKLGYNTIFGDTTKIVRARDNKLMHESKSRDGLYTVDLTP